MRAIFLMFALAVAGVGCSSVERSALLGISTGAVTGHVARSYMGGREYKKAAIESALFLGFVGGIGGLLIHDGLEKRDERVKKKSLLDLNDFDRVQIPYPRSGE